MFLTIIIEICLVCVSSAIFAFDNVSQSNTMSPLNDSSSLDLQQKVLGQKSFIQGQVPALTPIVSSCTCVPPGSCSTSGPAPAPNDGGGQIDIRIVNNPTTVPSAPLTCNYGLVPCCQPGPYSCGRRFPPPPRSPVNAPGQAAFGAYPWQAALLTTGDLLVGSGALIDSVHVLTAAHKVFNIQNTFLKVRLGEWDASNTLEPIPAEDVTVARIFVNPNFNQVNLKNDIAILRLSRNVDLTQKSTIGTVCLPVIPFVGQRCFVAGWGKNDFGPLGSFQSVQRQVEVPLIANSACQVALRSTRLGPGFVLDDTSFICAGGEGQRDACTGDGGSPLVCTTNGRWYVVGLVAWGIGCATSGVPGVYVNVATYLPWIRNTILTP